MYFKFSLRKHPQTGKLSGYYRLVESYRNSDNSVCHRSILDVGFMEGVTPEQLIGIQKQLDSSLGAQTDYFPRGRRSTSKAVCRRGLETYCRIKKTGPGIL